MVPYILPLWGRLSGGGERGVRGRGVGDREGLGKEGGFVQAGHNMEGGMEWEVKLRRRGDKGEDDKDI